MEREARARFHVVRINRWFVAIGLVLALAALLWPSRGLLPASGPKSQLVKRGVTVYGLDFSGKTEDEARSMLEQLAASSRVMPVDARPHSYADGTPYTVPELNGYEIDVDLTWLRLAMAPENSAVEPVMKVQPASTRLEDFPNTVIRQGNAEKQAVGMLINVDWGTPELAKMLPILKKKGAKATFFLSGNWAKNNPAMTRLIAADGHEIATHGHLLTQGPKALAAAGTLKADIEKSVVTIEEITGTKVKYYAPHMSEVNEAVLKTAADLKLRTVLYSLDTVDWKEDWATPERILGTFQKAKAGDLILMHPKANTVRALEQAIDLMHSRGYQLLTLTEMLSPDPTPTKAGMEDGD